jgi:hypothetical protein
MLRLGLGWLLVLSGAMTCATRLNAQTPFGQPYQQPYNAGGFTRPPMLSPYLNLARGANPVASYLYGSRLTNPNPYGLVPQAQPQVGNFAGGFLPQAQIPVEAAQDQQFLPGGVPIRLASPAHPVSYGNQFAGHGNYFSVYATNVPRGGAATTFPRPQSATNGLGTINLQQRSSGLGNQQPTAPAGGRRPTITALP